jgi:hypothetical protein
MPFFIISPWTLRKINKQKTYPNLFFNASQDQMLAQGSVVLFRPQRPLKLKELKAYKIAKTKIIKKFKKSKKLFGLTNVLLKTFQKLISRFSKHGQKKKIENYFVNSVYMLKVKFGLVNIYSKLYTRICDFKPYAKHYVPRLKKHLKTVRKVQTFIKPLMNERKRTTESSKLFYEAVVRKKHILKCTLATALMLEFYHMIKWPKNSLSFKLLRQTIGVFKKLKLYRPKKNAKFV